MNLRTTKHHSSKGSSSSSSIKPSSQSSTSVVASSGGPSTDHLADHDNGHLSSNRRRSTATPTTVINHPTYIDIEFHNIDIDNLPSSKKPIDLSQPTSSKQFIPIPPSLITPTSSPELNPAANFSRRPSFDALPYLESQPPSSSSSSHQLSKRSKSNRQSINPLPVKRTNTTRIQKRNTNSLPTHIPNRNQLQKAIENSHKQDQYSEPSSQSNSQSPQLKNMPFTRRSYQEHHQQEQRTKTRGSTKTSKTGDQSPKESTDRVLRRRSTSGSSPITLVTSDQHHHGTKTTTSSTPARLSTRSSDKKGKKSIPSPIVPQTSKTDMEISTTPTTSSPVRPRSGSASLKRQRIPSTAEDTLQPSTTTEQQEFGSDTSLLTGTSEYETTASPRPSEMSSATTTSTGPKQCMYCGVKSTPMWRTGPKEYRLLCNSCGVKWKRGRILKNLKPGRLSFPHHAFFRSSTSAPTSGGQVGKDVKRKSSGGGSAGSGGSSKPKKELSLLESEMTMEMRQRLRPQRPSIKEKEISSADAAIPSSSVSTPSGQGQQVLSPFKIIVPSRSTNPPPPPVPTAPSPTRQQPKASQSQSQPQSQPKSQSQQPEPKKHKKDQQPNSAINLSSLQQSLPPASPIISTKHSNPPHSTSSSASQQIIPQPQPQPRTHHSSTPPIPTILDRSRILASTIEHLPAHQLLQVVQILRQTPIWDLLGLEAKLRRGEDVEIPVKTFIMFPEVRETVWKTLGGDEALLNDFVPRVSLQQNQAPVQKTYVKVNPLEPTHSDTEPFFSDNEYETVSSSSARGYRGSSSSEGDD